ncbi:MAG: rhodanese-like domain-containing protein [Actinomycetota bacterium]|nr:rhodanese-like domain-containing protein [Actinomycetota bacterium]
MRPPPTVKAIGIEEARSVVDAGGAFVDLRDVESYLDVHIPGSLALLYESGPGMAGRARDCLPLEIPLVLLDLGVGDMPHAAASLRGKGFDVVGKLDDGINAWARHGGTPASTETVRSPDGGVILDIGDPGTARHDAALRIPIETLWHRVDEVRDATRVVVMAGYGVRAALAVGILERAGIDVVFWKTVAQARPSPLPSPSR